MKRLLIPLMVLFLTVSIVQAQKTYVLQADSISNSLTEFAYINLDTFAPYDSVALSVYASGEIDLDSLDVQGGIYLTNFDYAGSVVTSLSSYEALEGATLTINNADGVATYVQKAAVVTKAEAAGYNRLKVSVKAAASGNDATDAGQKYIIVYTVFK